VVTPPLEMRTVFLHTFGCQMNESDSLRMLESLEREGWSRTERPDDADLILLNTCAIREKAEQKLFSALGRYREQRDARGTLIGVAGCVAQQEKGRLLRRAPYVDFVLGPDNLAALPELVAQCRTAGGRRQATDWMDSSAYVFPRAEVAETRGAVTAFVTAMKGCDNVCSFCVVPHTRGREMSRPYPELIAEVDGLVRAGVREVTLIGQNVNSYAGGCDFPSLIRRVAAVPDLRRIRFTTSHPQDFGEGLIRCFAELTQLCPHLHLPVQSGSDTVLARMRRSYRVSEYEGKIAVLRAAVPNISLTSDVIVGFPGETEADFEATLDLIERIRFDQLFSFVYSSRPHTAAQLREEEWGRLEDEVKVARLERLQARQREISAARMAQREGQEVEVLVEGASRTDATRRFGRTPENWTVNFRGDAPAGALAVVAIERSTPNSLYGEQSRVTANPPERTATARHAPSKQHGLPVLA
jgi:tRNA-2-methylthio-N6-dimethylallyladenosine synthase